MLGSTPVLSQNISYLKTFLTLFDNQLLRPIAHMGVK